LHSIITEVRKYNLSEQIRTCVLLLTNKVGAEEPGNDLTITNTLTGNETVQASGSTAGQRG
jgi:hypothetical protein